MPSESAQPPARPRTEFYDTLGVVVDSPEPGTARVEMPSAQGFRNSRGEIHGGAVLALVDMAASSAVRSALGAGDALATVSVTMNFVHPAAAPATAIGRVTSVGGRVAFAHVDVESGGRIVAQGVATLRLFRRARDESGAA